MGQKFAWGSFPFRCEISFEKKTWCDVSQGLESCLHFISASRFVASERGVADFAGNVSKVKKKLHIPVNNNPASVEVGSLSHYISRA